MTLRPGEAQLFAGARCGKCCHPIALHVEHDNGHDYCAICDATRTSWAPGAEGWCELEQLGPDPEPVIRSGRITLPRILFASLGALP